MPTNAYSVFYDCKGDGTVLRPAEGLWRILLLWDDPCPLIQQARTGDNSNEACCIR